LPPAMLPIIHVDGQDQIGCG
jgi:hypothetical protein